MKGENKSPANFTDSVIKTMQFWNRQNFISPKEIDFPANLQKQLDAYSIGDQFLYVYDFKVLRMRYVSRSFERVLGFNNTDVTMEFIYDLLHPEDKSKVIEIARAVAEIVINNKHLPIRNAIRSTDMRMRKADGSYIKMLQQTVIFQSDEAGNPTATLGIFTDITHLNRGTEVHFSIDIPELDALLRKLLASREINEPKLLLSEREQQVAALLVKGKSSNQIAEQLHISTYTADTHRKNIKQKLKAKNTAELISFIVEKGL